LAYLLGFAGHDTSNNVVLIAPVDHVLIILDVKRDSGRRFGTAELVVLDLIVDALREISQLDRDVKAAPTSGIAVFDRLFP